MQYISLCNNKTQHYKQKLYDIQNRCENVRRLQREKYGGAYATASLRCR